MRPQKFERLFRKAIRLFVWHQDSSSLHDLKDGIRGWILRDIRESIREGWSVDYRTGYETYGYDGPAGVVSQMAYISDRFGASFRMRWVLNGLEDGHFDFSKEEYLISYLEYECSKKNVYWPEGTYGAIPSIDEFNKAINKVKSDIPKWIEVSFSGVINLGYSGAPIEKRNSLCNVKGGYKFPFHLL